MATKVNTDKGTLNWAYLSGKGTPTLKEGILCYKIDLILHKDRSVSLIKAITAEYDKNHVAKFTKGTTGYKQCNKEGGLDSKGDYFAFTFSTNVEFKDKKTGEMIKAKVKIYNSKAKEISLGTKLLGNGSEGCVAGAIGYYTHLQKDGTKLFLRGVQITKFLEYSDVAFEAQEEEGGFEGVKEEECGFIGEEVEETFTESTVHL